MAKSRVRLEDVELLPDGLLPDEVVERLVSELSPSHRLFLAGLGRGLTPGAAARRAGWVGEDVDRIAASYLDSDPTLRRLADHILRLRELASMDGEEPTFKSSGSIH